VPGARAPRFTICCGIGLSRFRRRNYLKAGPFLHDQLFCKPPLHGGQVAWHQDYSYWDQDRACCTPSCWIGLTIRRLKTAALHTCQGVNAGAFCLSQDWRATLKAIDTVLTRNKERSSTASDRVEKGEAFVSPSADDSWSYRNRTTRPRKLRDQRVSGRSKIRFKYTAARGRSVDSYRSPCAAVLSAAV